MVAAILLQKRRLVAILEQACEDDSALHLKKRRRKDKTVRFSEDVQEHYFSNYLESMTKAEREKVRSSIWYSRPDFDEFLMDRVNTIRVWRSVGGDMNDLQDHYCLRGLEPYQSSSLNAEMHSHRYLYTKSIMNEQKRMRCANKYDPFLVAAHVSHMSTWALQQARRLGLEDEEEVDRINREALYRHNMLKQQQQQRRIRSSRRFSMAAVPATCSSISLSGPHKEATAHIPVRTNVDVNLLKQMNVKFLQQIVANGQQPGKGDVAGDATCTMSLNSLMRGMQQQPHRRHSLNVTTVEQNELDMSQPFLAIRRDSLHGLMSHRTEH